MSMRRSLCPHCRKRLEPDQRIHPACIDGYAEALQAKADRVNARKARELEKLDRALTRQRKAALKTIPDLIKEAQIEFNKFCRERDRQAGFGCISSGRDLDWSGNAVDAGHYRSVGAAPHLRFDERNCHAQSKHDNQWKAGNVVDYRIGLIKRIGLEAVEALESDNRVHRWTREELIQIRDKYRARLRELKRQEA